MNKKRLLILWISFCLAGCSTIGTPGQPITGTATHAVTATSAPAVATQPAATAAPAGASAPSATATTAAQNAGSAPTQTTQPLQPTAAVQPTQPPALPTNTTAPASVPATGPAAQIPVNTLLDYSVVDSGGNMVGAVKDLVINQGANGVGQIPYIVITSNAREDWEIPVPWKSIQLRPDTQTVILPATASQLANAPGFNKDAWPVSFTAANAALQSYWANPAQAGMVQMPMGGTAADYIRAKDLTDLKIVSPQGSKLGKIKDVAIDWANSQPGGAVDAAKFSYVILQLDDSINAAEPMVPIPWRLVQMTPQQETATLNLTAQVLQSIPNFANGTWPNLYAEPWSSQLSQFWNNK